MKKRTFILVTGGLVVIGALGAFLLLRGDTAKFPETAGMGPSPIIKALIPTIHIAPARGWPAGGKPIPANGLAVNAFATGLDHPRWLHVLPNGDVLVAETNAPSRPEDEKGFKGFIAQIVQRWAGAGVASANRITLLRSTAAGGTASKSVLLSDLNSPFGMALIDSDLYVANTDALMRFHYTVGATVIGRPNVDFGLPHRRDRTRSSVPNFASRPCCPCADADGRLRPLGWFCRANHTPRTSWPTARSSFDKPRTVG
jgi:glucose/arabinose dehydrogenase